MNTATGVETGAVVPQRVLGELWSIVRGLESVEAELVELYERKDRALRTADAERLLELSEQERAASERLDSLLRRRYDVIQRSQRAGWPVTSLLQLGQLLHRRGTLSDREWAELEAVCRRVQDQAARLRRAGWVHWVVARRVERHQRELLELIGRGGGVEPTYGDAGSSQRRAQPPRGVLLDHHA